MAQRVVSESQRTKKVPPVTQRHTGWRGGTNHLARYTTRKLARTGRTCTSSQNVGGRGHLDQFSHEAVLFERQSIKCTNETELFNVYGYSY